MQAEKIHNQLMNREETNPPVLAYCVLGNLSSIEIYYADSDSVVARYPGDDPEIYEIEYTSDEDATPFFTIGKLEIALSDCFKVR